MAFTMTGFSDVKPLYEQSFVQINGHEWTVNIMMFGETTLVLLAAHEPGSKMGCPRP